MAKKGNRAKGLKLYGNTPNLFFSHGESVEEDGHRNYTATRRARAVARVILSVLSLAIIAAIILVAMDTMARGVALAIVEYRKDSPTTATAPSSATMSSATTLAMTTTAVPVVAIIKATAENAELAPVSSDALDAPTSDVAPTYTEEDLELLAKVIYWEAGATWLPDGVMWKVGSVVLNRVDSPEYPDTLREVIFQRGQYAGVNSSKFATLVPSKAAYEVAEELLSGGERAFPPITIGQAGWAYGPIREVVKDPYGILSTIYFFDSTHSEKY